MPADWKMEKETVFPDHSRTTSKICHTRMGAEELIIALVTNWDERKIGPASVRQWKILLRKPSLNP